VLLQLAGVPALGSDALTLSATLDKLWAGRLVAAAGVPVVPQRSIGPGDEVESVSFPSSFPLFVKPRWEGTSKGIGPHSRVEDLGALRAAVARIHADYEQPALVERLLEGPEYTVTVVGNAPPRALPALQRALETRTRVGVHALERHPAPPGGWRFETPGRLDAALETRLADLAIRAYEALECKDFARADFKLDRDGEPYFLEMNPLPTFAPDASFGILAELEGRPLEDLLADVLRGGLERLGLA
jgi:D-alanine-D-alanine ligase